MMYFYDDPEDDVQDPATDTEQPDNDNSMNMSEEADVEEPQSTEQNNSVIDDATEDLKDKAEEEIKDKIKNSKNGEQGASDTLDPTQQTQDVAEQMQQGKNKPSDPTDPTSKPGEGGPKKTGEQGGNNPGGKPDAPGGKPDMPGGKPGAPGGQDLAKKGGEEAAKKATEEVGKQAAKESVKQAGTQAVAHGASAGAAAGGATAAGGTAATAATAATPVGWVILIIIAVILLIMIIIGVVFFFLAMPGQIMAKAKELGVKVLDAFTAVVKGQEDVIHTEDMAEVANYLENMGYDLKGEGFVSSDKTDSDVKDNQYLDVAQGVVRDNDTGKVTDLNSDPIMTYMVSDNLCYIVKNFNQNLDAATGGHGDEAIGWIGGILAAIGVAAAIIFSPITAIVAVAVIAAGSYLAFATASNPNWGTGLISIWHESSMGVKGNAYDVKERGFIELTPETKKMKIKRGWNNQAYTYDVDGWGGQYGMPLEFLLSVHAATQMPDLAMNMATAFDTDVEVLLHKVDKGDVDAGFVAEDGSTVTRSEVMEAATANNGAVKNFWNWLCRGVEELTGIDTDSGEAVTLDDSALEELHTELNLPHDPDNCTCKTEEGKWKECDACKNYIRDIIAALNAINDDVADSYTPYISQVKDHWFRDVYFVRQNPSSTEVTEVDEDYFYLTEERWTIYETYSDSDTIPEGFEVGDYKLYEYDNGTYTLSTRTKEEVDKLNEDLEAGDLDAVRLIKKPASKTLTANYDSIWSAYDIQDYEDEVWQTLAVSDDSPDVIKKFEGKLKYKSRKPGDIAQVEDGERGVTNEKIKNMFVNNLYYQYDGTTTRADAISEDRQKTDREKDNTSNDERNKDLLGRVALGRDSLGAFSMLENTHTLDADYVYKNFKELIVELNYFDKEELSNKVKEVMQWPIPECGSSGWPIRKYEKGVDYYGTLINSKVDLELLNKYDAEKLRQREEERAKDKAIEDAEKEILDFEKDNPIEESSVSGTPLTGSISSKLSFRDSTGIKNDILIGKLTGGTVDITNSDKNGAQYEITINGVTYTRYFQGGQSYSGNHFTWSGSDKTIGAAACGPTSMVNILTGYGYDLNPEKDITGLNFSATCQGLVELYAKWTDGGTSQAFSGDYEKLITEAFEEGKPVIVLVNGASRGYPDDFWTTGGHFVACLGVDDQGNLITADPAGNGNYERMVYPKGISGIVQYMSGLWIPDEAPSGVIKNNPFVGYDPDQAVVAPITGKIIEYGIEGGSGEHAPIKRVNIETGEEEEVEWIKIQAVDNFMYHTKGDGTSYSEGRGYLNCTKINDKEYDSFKDKASETDQQHEGYDYFYEEYQNICDGYVLYIEGFDLTAFDSDGSKALFDGGDTDSAEVTQYIENKVYNMTDNLKEARAIWKEEAKSAADPYWQVGEDLYIKEGTVIGKTLEDPEIDESKLQTSITTESGECVYPGNGNYIRLIFRDLEDSIVEDVESYMPLDDKQSVDNDWELFYWLPFESGGTDIEGCGPESQGTCSNGETACGIIQWTVLLSSNMNNIADQFIPACLEKDPSLCAPLSAYSSWSAQNFWDDYCGAKQFQATLKLICQKDRDAFLHVQMEVAKDQYLQPLLDQYSWLADRPSCVQGEIMHLKVWGADTSWVSGFSGSTDEEIIKKVRYTIANTSSTAGAATGDETTGRAFNEPEIALGILGGKYSADDIEQWVRNDDVSVFDFDFRY